jgi:uncharacterized protein YkwD
VAPADSQPFDVAAATKVNLDKINAFRAQENLPPLALDQALTAAANEGTREFAAGGGPHGHFREHRREIKDSVHATVVNENQGKRGGHPAQPVPIDEFVAQQIETLITNMFDEGPGGGHHDSIVNPRYRRIGIGIAVIGQFVYLTNDFAD